MSKIELLLHKLRTRQLITQEDIGAAEAESGILQAIAGHVDSSIDKDNDWGPIEWEQWNKTASQMVAALKESWK